MTNYDADFYGSHSDSSVLSAERVVPHVNEIVQPKSVLDVGSGTGAWLKAWLKTGADCLGVDGDYVPKESLLIPDENFRPLDVLQPFDLGRTFDLVMTLEVAEHLDAPRADDFVASLTRHGDVIMFSAAIPGQGGTDHVNEQWPSYWAAKFAKHGYGVYDVLRPVFWGDQDVATWYKQNMLIFATPARAEALGLVASSAPLDIVHPEQFAAVTQVHLATRVRSMLVSSPGGMALRRARNRLLSQNG